MLSLRNFWRRHKRKILITAGVLGSGYFLCKLYNAHQQKLADLERELARQRANDEIIKAQLREFDFVFVFLSPPLVYDVLLVLMLCRMIYIFRLQEHFENVQLIADTTSLPHAMQYLRTRILELLDLSQLTERLQKGKGQPTTLTPSEKFELWDRLKILSFTQMLVSLWAVTMLTLYIKVQVNILGRHLYIDTARGLGSSLLLLLTDPESSFGDLQICMQMSVVTIVELLNLIVLLKCFSIMFMTACRVQALRYSPHKECKLSQRFSQMWKDVSACVMQDCTDKSGYVMSCFGRFVRKVWEEENVDIADRDDQQKFLASADFLANNGLLALVTNIQAVVTEVLEGKKLTDLFNTNSLHESVMQILNKFMSVGSPHQWIDYLMPEDCGHYKLGPSSSIDDTILPESSNFDQLMMEARAVLSSAEFGKIMGISLKVAVDALVEDMEAQSQSTGASLTSGMPLAKLLSRILQTVPSLLGEASQNQIIQIIRHVPEVELFFTLLYANNLVV
ncbi:hypothetical protein SADUNF_Sadunf15G0035200 [Salix dunnii]|uniref:Peroxin-3 n=1 Tax=Salix dunnii TaxID=1413687 RepID=A0A835JFG7_9ROSI|nr:hypothetical protein SADUNF_Sadunf15G0035200 [Salix dunnii]